MRVAKGPSGRPCKWALACLNVSNLSSGMQAVFEYDGAIAAGSSTTIAKTVVRVQYQVRVVGWGGERGIGQVQVAWGGGGGAQRGGGEAAAPLLPRRRSGCSTR